MGAAAAARANRRDWVRDAVFGREWRVSALGVAADDPLRGCADRRARGRAYRREVLVSRRILDLCRGAAAGLCGRSARVHRHGGAALDCYRLISAATLRSDEDRARSGAGAVFPLSAAGKYR